MAHRRERGFSAQRAFGCAACLVILAADLLVPPDVGAENTVSVSIVSAGTVRAYVVDGELRSICYSNHAQTDSGELHIRVSDERGTGAGWTVSLLSSDFIYYGASLIGRDIPSANFSIQSVSDPVLLEGQSRVVAGPNRRALSDITLDASRTVMSADPGSGSGEYDQAIAVILTIPAGSQTGTYVATLTVALSAAP